MYVLVQLQVVLYRNFESGFRLAYQLHKHLSPLSLYLPPLLIEDGLREAKQGLGGL